MLTQLARNYSDRIIFPSLIVAILAISGCDKDHDSIDILDTNGGIDNIEYSVIYTDTITDGVNDLELLPVEQDGPPYSEPYDLPHIDVTQILLGINGDYLYMRVQFRGVIPADEIPILASGEVEAQIVTNQGMNIALNTDNDQQTGGGGEAVSGIDIFFAINFTYGTQSEAYCNYDFATNDVHDNRQHLAGLLIDGGPKHDFVVARYNITGLGTFFPRGVTVELGEWSEAESYNADGTLKYHHFAFDPLDQGTTWTIPAE